MRIRTNSLARTATVVALSAMLLGNLPVITANQNGNLSVGSDACAIAKAKVLFKVTKPDKKIKSYSLDDLKKFKLGRITVQGKIEEGPLLMDVLKNAGVKKYSKVTLKGRDGSITRTSKQITKNVILDFTNRGTVKFCSTDVPKEKWIHDITEIKAVK
jgi:hypothetical protein